MTGSGSPLLEDLTSSMDCRWTVDARGVIVTDSADHAVSYSETALDLLDHSSSSWWNEHRVTWALTQMRALGVDQLVDVGAGNGAMALRLRDVGIDVIAVEPLYRGACRIADGGVPALCGTLDELEVADGTLPALGYFDVLEHLDTAERELATAFRTIRSGGVLLITAPAHQWLWSEEDDLAGHLRRYTRRSIDAACSRVGFVSIHSQYLFTSLVLPALLVRRLPYLLRRLRPSPSTQVSKIDRQLDPGPLVSDLARALLRAERAIGARTPLPCGLTVAAAYRKP